MASPAGTQQSRHPDEPGAIAALVLAGGRAARLGGADKPAIVINRRSLLSTAASAALGAGARRIVIVGPARPGLIRDLIAEHQQPEQPPGIPSEIAVEFTTERPPGAGPVPALSAGLDLVSEPWLYLLAADLPFLSSDHLTALLASARQASAAAGAIFVDADDHPQWLVSCWQTARLRTALRDYQGSSLGGLLGPLRPVEVTASVTAGSAAAGSAPPWLDCDTSEDLAAALALAARDEPTEERGST